MSNLKTNNDTLPTNTINNQDVNKASNNINNSNQQNNIGDALIATAVLIIKAVEGVLIIYIPQLIAKTFHYIITRYFPGAEATELEENIVDDQEDDTLLEKESLDSSHLEDEISSLEVIYSGESGNFNTSNICVGDTINLNIDNL